MNKNEYKHSRPLDVHRWSEHTEVNKFVDDIYKTYFKQKTNIRKKHLNGLPFGQPSKHTLQNMLTHQLLRATGSHEMVRSE